jgi:hypothetical protein
MVLTADCTVHVFADGRTNHMHYRPLIDEEWYREIARANGFEDDALTYNRAHDAAHHLVAAWLGKPWSIALHDPEPCPLGDASQEMKDEEHLADAMLRYAIKGEADPHCRIYAAFGTKLDDFFEQLRDIVSAIRGAGI